MIRQKEDKHEPSKLIQLTSIKRNIAISDSLSVQRSI